MSQRFVNGYPYSAEFFDEPEQAGDPTITYAIIEPPIDLARCDVLIDMVQHGSMEVESYASTLSKTILQFTVGYSEIAPTHTTRVASAYQTLSYIIDDLNSIEAGTFKMEYRG